MALKTRVVRAIGKRLPAGDVLIIGRDVDEAIEISMARLNASCALRIRARESAGTSAISS
jgi:hypothetical protein